MSNLTKQVQKCVILGIKPFGPFLHSLAFCTLILHSCTEKSAKYYFQNANSALSSQLNYDTSKWLILVSEKTPKLRNAAPKLETQEHSPN